VRSFRIVLQGFVGWNGNLALLAVSQARPLYFELAFGKLHPSRLRSMPKDLAAGLAWGARSSDLLGAQRQNRFNGFPPDFVDHPIDSDPSFGYQIDKRQQKLPIGSSELFNDSGACSRLAPNDMVRLLHGGGVLFLGLIF
jgi:hypothetical protein